jgi:hypothetical protein
LKILSRKENGDQLVLEMLLKYRETHPENPNAHRFLFEFLMEKVPDSLHSGNSGSVECQDKEKTDLLKKCLISYNKAVPMDKEICFKLIGKFHDQGDAKWIVIRGQLKCHNDTPFGRPTPGRPIGRLVVGRPQCVFGGLSYY